MPFDCAAPTAAYTLRNMSSSFLSVASQRPEDSSFAHLSASDATSRRFQLKPNPPASAAKTQAAAAFRSGNYAEALFAQAIALGGRDPHLLHANRSAAFAAYGNHARALAAADEALETEGASAGFAKGHCRRAVALAAINEWAAGERACAAALGAHDVTDRAPIWSCRTCAKSRQLGPPSQAEGKASPLHLQPGCRLLGRTRDTDRGSDLRLAGIGSGNVV